MTLQNNILSQLSQDAATPLMALLQDGLDTGQGVEAMLWLLAHRPSVAHEMLCRWYDVSWYQVGDSCFRDQYPFDAHSQWFVSVAAGGPLDGGAPIPLADTAEQARALAVEALQLDRAFFGTWQACAGV